MDKKGFGHSSRLADALIKKINKTTSHDYTIITSAKHAPLYYLSKSYQQLFPKRSIRVDICISKITDPIARQRRACPKLWIETSTLVRLLTDPVLERLLSDRVAIEYNDGSGSYYDPRQMIISIKGAQDFIHEIGHHVWNCWLIGSDEEQKRVAVNESLEEGGQCRKHLPDGLIPDAHREYADLVGAYSGQFLEDPEKTTLSNRRNDLEEHFARNFDYLMRGRALDVLNGSRARLNDLLGFFVKHGLLDRPSLSFYKYFLKKCHGKESLRVIGNPIEAKDGVEISRDELFQYHKAKRMFETGKPMQKMTQVALALDLSEDFIRFCVSEGGIKEIIQAVKQKGITLNWK